jgi:hypothetical protein
VNPPFTVVVPRKKNCESGIHNFFFGVQKKNLLLISIGRRERLADSLEFNRYVLYLLVLLAGTPTCQPSTQVVALIDAGARLREFEVRNFSSKCGREFWTMAMSYTSWVASTATSEPRSAQVRCR